MEQVGTLLNIQESPSQRPILKPSSYLDISPLNHNNHNNRKPSFRHQNSMTNDSLLESTQHASFLPPVAPLPSNKVRFNRASTMAMPDPFGGVRKRSTSTNVKLNKSVLVPAKLLDESSILPQPQLNISFQNNSNNQQDSVDRDSVDSSLLDIPILASFLSTPNPPPRARSQTVAAKPTRRPTIVDVKDKRKSIMVNRQERSLSDKFKLRSPAHPPMPNPTENKRSFSVLSIKPGKQDLLLKQVIGSLDPLKKSKVSRYLELSVNKMLKIDESKQQKEKEAVETTKKQKDKGKDEDKDRETGEAAKKRKDRGVSEPSKKQKDKEMKVLRGLMDATALSKEFKGKQGDKAVKELKGEGLDEVKEIGREDKEEKKKDILEFVFYKEIHDVLNFCVGDRMKYFYLKVLKLLGVFYLHYEKLDEAFCCFGQLRWASEYLGMYKSKSSAFYKLAECCKLVENYDEAIKLLRKSLQYSWEYNLVNREMKIYDLMGKLYYLKGEIKKAQYYNERFANGISEPKDSPLREKYNQLLVDNKEIGRYGLLEELDENINTRIALPALPKIQIKFNKDGLATSLNVDDQKRKELDERPKNVKNFKEQLLVLITDSELVLQRKQGVDGNEAADDQQEGPEMVELPSPSFKANFAELDSGKTNEQRLRELKIKEERLNSVIRNAKKELGDITEEGDRKKSMHNIFELQIAFQREKRLILGQQQAYRIHLAKLWKSQYHVFENKKKPGICRANIKTESNIVMENKYDMALDDPDFFQGVKKKVMALRFENNLPPFVLMTHKKMPQKPMKKDLVLLNETAKKIYLKFGKKLMKKIDPARVKYLAKEEEEASSSKVSENHAEDTRERKHR